MPSKRIYRIRGITWHGFALLCGQNCFFLLENSDGVVRPRALVNSDSTHSIPSIPYGSKN
jgi:hypothetical protein